MSSAPVNASAAGVSRRRRIRVEGDNDEDERLMPSSTGTVPRPKPDMNVSAAGTLPNHAAAIAAAETSPHGRRPLTAPAASWPASGRTRVDLLAATHARVMTRDQKIAPRRGT